MIYISSMESALSVSPCRGCNKEYPSTEFLTGKNQRGLCRACRRVYNNNDKVRRQTHHRKLAARAEADILIPASAICGVCKQMKSGSEFVPDRRLLSGVQSICKECCAARARRARVVLAARPSLPALVSKVCPSCRVRRPADQFYKNKSMTSGLSSECKPCIYKRQRGRRLTHYGLSPAAYVLLLTQQNGVCAICGSAPGKKLLCVDHNHVTNLVRGLLCANCNAGLGQFKDLPALLDNASLYLKTHDSVAI